MSWGCGDGCNLEDSLFGGHLHHYVTQRDCHGGCAKSTCSQQTQCPIVVEVFEAREEVAETMQAGTEIEVETEMMNGGTREAGKEEMGVTEGVGESAGEVAHAAPGAVDEANVTREVCWMFVN